jgi:hypothetical protein
MYYALPLYIKVVIVKKKQLAKEQTIAKHDNPYTAMVKLTN